MISAKLVFKVGLISLAASVVSFSLVAYGINEFRIVGFITILSGVAAVAVGLISMATGTLKDDLKN